MRHSLQLAIAAAALCAIPTAASASVNLVNNGSFEAPVISDPCCNTVPPDLLPGWTVNSGSVNVVNGTYNTTSSHPNLAYEGNQYLDLVGQDTTGDISQFLNTVAGQVYTLTFAYANNIFAGATSASAEVTIGTLDAVISHNTSSTSDLDWTIFTGTFVGTGSPMELEFASLLGEQNGSTSSTQCR